MIEARTQFMVGRLSTESGKCNSFNLDGIFGNYNSWPPGIPRKSGPPVLGWSAWQFTTNGESSECPASDCPRVH